MCHHTDLLLLPCAVFPAAYRTCVQSLRSFSIRAENNRFSFFLPIFIHVRLALPGAGAQQGQRQTSGSSDFIAWYACSAEGNSIPRYCIGLAWKLDSQRYAPKKPKMCVLVTVGIHFPLICFIVCSAVSFCPRNLGAFWHRLGSDLRATNWRAEKLHQGGY